MKEILRERIWLVTCHSHVLLCTSTFCAKAATDVRARESKFRASWWRGVSQSCAHCRQQSVCQGSCSTYVIWSESQVYPIVLFPCWDAAEQWTCSNNNRKLVQLADGRSAPEWNDLCQKLRKKNVLRIFSVNPPQDAEVAWWSPWFLFSLSSRVHCKQELLTADSADCMCRNVNK